MALHRVWLGPKNTTGTTRATAKAGMKTAAPLRSSQVRANTTRSVTSSAPKLTTVFMPMAPIQ